MGKERWDCRISENVTNKKIDDFLDEIVKVCKKHNMSISHEDQHGGFEITDFDQHCVDWLREASIGREFTR